MLLLLLLLLYLCDVKAQYPNILFDSTITLGQCVRDSDCDIYLINNASLVLAGLYCNYATSRCELANGQALGPAFTTMCPGVTMSTQVYPSFSQYTDPPQNAYMRDGMIIVTMAFSNTVTFSGVLRLYLTTLTDPQFDAQLNLYNISLLPFVEDQYVNFPVTTYIFRNLVGTPAVGGYELQYFDISGCIIKFPVSIKVKCVNSGCPDSTYFGVTYAMPPFCSAGFVPTFPVPSSIGIPTQPLRYVTPYYRIDASQRIASFSLYTCWYTSSDPSYPYNRRCPFGQVLDMTGRPIYTTMRDQMISANVGLSPPYNGFAFPPGGINGAFDTAYAYGSLSGFIKMQTGVGYCTYQSGVEIPMVNAVGIVEAFNANEYMLDFTNLTGLPFVPGFQPARMYFNLNIFQLNTYLLKIGDFDHFGPLGADVDLTRNPVITVSNNASSQQSNQYSYCQSNPNGATIFYDYSEFTTASFFFDLSLVQIDIYSTNLTEVQVAIAYNVFLPGSFTVTQFGFYCINMLTNFLDGLYYRVVLRSCFQVGQEAAATTQLRSFFTSVGPDIPFPPLPYSGYGAPVVTEIYLTLPLFLFIPTGYEPRVRLFRFSPDAYDESLILNYGGGVVPVFDNEFGYLDIAEQYAIAPSLSTVNVTVYRSLYSPFNRYNYIQVLYNGAAEVRTEITLVQYEVFKPATVTQYVSPSPPYNTFLITTPEVVDYRCSTLGTFNLIAEMRLYNEAEVTQPVCPDQDAIVYGFTVGGFCMPVTNPILNSMLNSMPFLNPCTYFQSYYNVNDPNNPIFLYGSQNAFVFPAPANTEIEFRSIDMMGMVARTIFNSASKVPANSTFIDFLPVQPFCMVNPVNGSTQYVRHEFVIGGIVNNVVVINGTNFTVGPIFGWQPLNLLALGQYNPNSPFFNVPYECALLNTMTALEVYNLCNNNTLNPSCVGCAHLPPQYEGTNGTILETNVEGWWEAYAWVPSTVYNPISNRSLYCRWALSVLVTIPTPMFFIPTNLRRINRNGSPCVGITNCYAVDMQIVIDESFNATYLSMVQIYASPAFGSAANATSVIPITADTHIVSLDTVYAVVLFLDNIFCTVTQTYVSDSVGPLIQVVRASHSMCNAPTGTATFYMVYNDPNIPTGSTASLCMYWPDRDKRTPTQEVSFYSFPIGVNLVNPTVLPFPPDFGINANTTLFYGVAAGLQTVVVYDRCVDVTNPGCNADCTTLINQNTLVLTNPLLRFQVFQFEIENFGGPGGGIVINLDSRIDARCYGDTYYLTFSVYDDIVEPGTPYGPYYVQFFEAFTNFVLDQSPTPCTEDYYAQTITGGQPLLNPLPVVGFKVKLFEFDTRIETGAQFGFRDSGNYTLVVRNCATGCVQTYAVFIDMVNPFDIILSTTSSNCAYIPGSIVTSFSGGLPFLPGQLYDQTYYLDDNNPIIYNSEYITYWNTPFQAPGQFVRTHLGIRNIPGNYTVIIEDRNQCNASKSIEVKSPPPIKVSLYGIDAACSSSTQAKIQFLVSGGIGPPYYTLQNLTLLSTGQNITFEFVTAFGQTLCFNVMDSVGCILSQQVCYQVPQPGPLNLSVTTTDSCPNQPTGTASVTLLGPNQTSYSCAWQADNGAILTLQSCNQYNIPPNTDLVVTVTNIIGCTGVATAYVKKRPPIVLSELLRTINGTYDQRPCIDIAIFSVYGGVYGPNYTVSLIHDTTGANITYNGNYSILMTGVCRSVQYVIAVSDGDGLCVQTFISVDPQYNFGGNTSDIPYPQGLPPFVNSEAGSFGMMFIYGDQPNTPTIIKEQKNPTNLYIFMLMFFGTILVLMFVGAIIFIALYFSNRKNQKKK